MSPYEELTAMDERECNLNRARNRVETLRNEIERKFPGLMYLIINLMEAEIDLKNLENSNATPVR